MCSSPCRDLIGCNIVAFRPKPLLDEFDLRDVVSMLGKHVATPGPRRYDVKGKPKSRPRVDLAKLAIRILHPLAGSALRGMIRRDMVSEATGFWIFMSVINRSVSIG